MEAADLGCERACLPAGSAWRACRYEPHGRSLRNALILRVLTRHQRDDFRRQFIERSTSERPRITCRAISDGARSRKRHWGTQAAATLGDFRDRIIGLETSIGANAESILVSAG